MCINGLVYRTHIILLQSLFFWLLTHQWKWAIGTSLAWNCVNMCLYYNYHYWFAKLFKMGKQDGAVIWFTGLPCSGKTTVSDSVYKQLKESNINVIQLDGDIMRQSLSKDLKFSKKDRETNLSRASFVADLLAKNQILVLCSFISPYSTTRNEIRNNTHNFIEIFVKASLMTCEQRDVKGMYAKARKGQIKKFTGISSPYEKPIYPELVLNTDKETVQKSTDKVIKYLQKRKLI